MSSSVLRVGASVVAFVEGDLHHGRVLGMKIDSQGVEWLAVRYLLGLGDRAREWVPAECCALLCGACGDCQRLNHRPKCMEWIGPGAVAAALGV